MLAGSTEPGILDVVTRVAIEKERPDWRGMLTGNYANGRVHSLARISYYGKFSSAQPGYCDACEETYGAKTLVDAEAGYQMSAVDVSIGARNQNCCSSRSRQNMPISSLETERSLMEAMMPAGVSLSPKRLRPIAR